MICSEDEDLDRRLEEYGRHLTVSGWKYKTAKRKTCGRSENHKSDAKLKKATKCGVADHVTKFKHPEDPQLGFLTIVAIETVKEKKDLIVRENYWMCNLGTIFKGMNTRTDLNTVLKDRSSKNEREREREREGEGGRENSLLKKTMGPCQL